MSSSSQTNRILAPLFRRAMFLILLLALTFIYLGLQFSGLAHPRAIEQAQTAREIARGNGYTSKVLYPIAIHKADKADIDMPPLEAASHQTFHSPLNPYLLAGLMKLIGVSENNDAEKWKLTIQDRYYKLDLLVASLSTLFFLFSVGVTFSLVSKLFDRKIASVVALLMILSDIFWDYALSGLPQMLLLALFSLGLLFAYNATEKSKIGHSAIGSIIAASLCFSLMPITHWLATWIVFGFILYSLLFIHPRGLAGILTIFFSLLFASFFLKINAEYTGSSTGTSLYVLYDALSGGNEMVYRSSEIPHIDLKRLLLNAVITSLQQVRHLFSNMGGLVIAPLFFLSLLYSFKKQAAASFRWGILSCWILASFGMSLFGLDQETPLHSNQLHLIFAPIMAAYGLAFLSILWTKVSIPQDFPLRNSLHFVIVILLSSGSLLLNLPQMIMYSLAAKNTTSTRLPYSLNNRLTTLVDPNHIVVSDQPWSVAWYADRTSIWLPLHLKSLDQIELFAENEQSPITAVLITPYSSAESIGNTYQQYRDYNSLVFDGWSAVTLGERKPKSFSSRDPKLSEFLAQYPDSEFLGNALTSLYYRRP